MQATLNWTHPITWLIVLALVTLLVVQAWLIFRNQSLSTGRRWLRAGLNFLLWLLLTGYFLQIRWPMTQPTKHALLIGDDVPASFARQISDSLHSQASFTSRTYKTDYDSVTLVGQNFPNQMLTQLSNATLRWIPYNQPDQLQAIGWKGIVRQGEMQQVTGQIQSSRKQMLRLRYGNKTLDSVAVYEGINAFSLQFPAFSKGRTQTELVLGESTAPADQPGESTLDTIRYFSRPTEPLTVQFLLNSPDFESKTLADWLGKQGHTVTILATLSKNISSSVTINKLGKSTGKPIPDLIITEPANAASATVRKAYADNRAVLFINLTNPETDCRAINQALGSRWQVRKLTNEPLIKLPNGLNALPYRFAENLNQFAAASYPVAVQQGAGRVGVSLLSETFPLALSGDSIAYNRIWTAVLTRLSPSDRSTIQVDAPVYNGLRQAVVLNNSSGKSAALRIGPDTVRVHYSPINERSATGYSSFRKSGWQTVQDSLSLYVNELSPDDPAVNRAVISQFMLTHSRYQSTGNQAVRTLMAQLPNWVWLLLLIACFTALWIEPKIV